MTPSVITAIGGVLVGLLGWAVTLARRKDDAAASLIDDLAAQVTEQRAQTEAQRALVTEATYQLRITLDYIYLLRAQIEATGHMPKPWPDSLTRR